MADIFNYADGNTVGVIADSINSMFHALQDVLEVMFYLVSRQSHAGKS